MIHPLLVQPAQWSPQSPRNLRGLGAGVWFPLVPAGGCSLTRCTLSVSFQPGHALSAAAADSPPRGISLGRLPAGCPRPRTPGDPSARWPASLLGISDRGPPCEHHPLQPPPHPSPPCPGCEQRPADPARGRSRGNRIAAIYEKENGFFLLRSESLISCVCPQRAFSSTKHFVLWAARLQRSC